MGAKITKIRDKIENSKPNIKISYPPKYISFEQISNYINITFKNCPESIMKIITEYIRGNSGLWSFIDTKN